LGVEFRDRLNPLKCLELSRSIETADLPCDASPDDLGARIGYHQAQLAQTAGTPPLAHRLHSLCRFYHDRFPVSNA
jgi:hypothetical protein